ncbi:RidA family protein [Pirellulales bacterium]|nr:RidA family protein [Pirellulales bacterium]MDA7938102.1 RidA family protein [Pirellulales bacterium]
MGAQERFKSLVDEPAAIAKPAGLYQPCLVVGDFAYVSGHLPVLPDGSLIFGCLGLDLEVEDGKAAARRAGLASLVTLEQALGSLNAIKRVVKLFGMVAATGSFTQHPAVVNGCSELYAEVWGNENGVGVRSALGVASLPAGVAVEIEAVFELS